MKSLPYFLAVLALVAACGSTKNSGAEKAEMPSNAVPRFEKMRSYFEMIDDDTEERVGFIEKVTYDDGRIVYWVTGLDRATRRGFILANGAGYKYDWIGGQRTEEPEFIGADTYSTNSRRILGYDRPVRLEAITIEALMKEYERTPQPQKKSEDGESE